MPLTLPTAPPAIAAAIERLKQELTRAAGANLAGLILYGGLARGRYRPGKSDVNVVVLLRDAAAPALAAIAPALRTARRAAEVVPLILSVADVAPTALVFPVKFLDIKKHHVVIAGEDPFATLVVPRADLGWRIAQEMRNLLLRLRQRFVAAVDDRAAHAASLADLARPLALHLLALLELAGRPEPRDDHTMTIFEAAATAFDLDGAALAELASLRRGEREPEDLRALCGQTLTVLTRATEHAERLREAPR